LTIALKNPGVYSSVSAFSPICAPTECPWGKKAFSRYLGDDQTHWRIYDSCALVASGKNKIPLLVEQGSADNFLAEQLQPEKLQRVCEQHQHPLELRMREGYDHSYFFIASFIEEHVA